MRNGIKKLFLTGLFVIFGMCFNSSSAYNVINECYKNNPTSSTASNQRPCLDFQPGEQLTIGNYTSYITGNFNFMSNNPLIFSSSLHFVGSSTYDSYSYTFYQNDGYITTLNTIYKDTETLFGTYIYTGGMYCLVSDTTDTYKFGVCSAGNYANSKMYSGTVEEAIAYMTGHTITGYRLLFDFRETTQGQINDNRNRANMGICAMLDNNTAVCIRALGSFNSRATNCNNSSCIYSGVNRTQDTNMGTGDITYSDLLTNYHLSSSPFTIEQQETTTETTTILGQCPTINEILSTYSSNYNTGICYSATRLLTQTGIVNTTAQSIFELYPTFTGWLEDYNYYKQYCENVPTSVCRQAFSGEEIKWSLLNKTPENNPIGVYQYCHLQLNIQDKNATTCVLSTGSYYATGVDEAIEEEIQGNQSVIDIMLNSFNNLKDELPSFSTGTVFDEFLEEGETWKDGFKLDIFKTFLELWSKITSIFIFRHQYDGIIPTYITSIIMIILLFKILKK